jgi:hypothetical protein
MWEPRRLTTLWAFMACYRDSFTFTFIIRPEIRIWEAGELAGRTAGTLGEQFGLSPHGKNRDRLCLRTLHPQGEGVREGWGNNAEHLYYLPHIWVGFYSSVGIATGYGLDGRGLIPGGGKRFFSTPKRPHSYPMGARGSFPGGKATGA